MPPKKSGKGGKGGKGKKGKGEKGGKIAPKKNEPVINKEFYSVQIKDLEVRLKKYQYRCDELEIANKHYTQKFEHQETEKKNIVEFLKKSLQDKGNEVQDLNDRLMGLQQAKDQEKEQYMAELQKIRTDFQEMKDMLTSENMILVGKLASLEEFKVQREDLMQKMRDLEQSILDKEKEHEDKIYKLEKKQVIDKDRLKKDMVARVNQVASEFRKVSNKQMAETTKRTIRENVSVNAQLAKMSDKTLELIVENDKLKEKEKRNKQHLDIMEDNEKELARKNHSNQKIIRMLTERCRNQETMLQEYEQREEAYQELEAEAQLLRQQNQSIREEAQNVDTENKDVEDKLMKMTKEIAMLTREREKLRKVLLDAALAIRATLIKPSPEDIEESDHEEQERRDAMLESLLVLLNSATTLGLTAGIDRHPTANPTRSTSLMPGSGKGFRKEDLASLAYGPPTSIGQTHYKLGDLGLIPRPDNYLPSHMERMKELSETSKYAQKRAVRSVGVQTVSAPKAMFYAETLLNDIEPDLIHRQLPPIYQQGQRSKIM